MCPMYCRKMIKTFLPYQCYQIRLDGKVVLEDQLQLYVDEVINEIDTQ
jgi:hypothetical protein